ncbi:aminotransferase class V-fold PLP-dependent enzyme [Aneurinibacillus sp. Ricciae_BoGa-3]|uniref:aminotransferase class V-fold PLP-dependent enzyme n=1 Tax=Aneurinibacillus sp. Ricciae_BoGa-3 TaxID=3022697 RepID=UPI002340BAA0|nr:aminotransferase class V-fold PLP-dependent enzyme [Aneurinibacillus sp. Ricciae_BoGa-3]WCK54516.1 aminotransferase class V-fold PLP-dependent enzyme [Aneurinibacillus sp. Ricciae_BoGa-3]
MEITYLDNAASTWPKPEGVAEAMMEAVRDYGANPGRGGHQLSMKASTIVYKARVKLAQLFSIKNPNDIVFSANATMALNQAIKGYVKPGMHVITTSLEHNSVRRPLEFLKRTAQIDITYIKPSNKTSILDDIAKAVHKDTGLIVVSHASNLLGSILPVAEIGQLAYDNRVPFLVDASQSAGVLTIDVEKMHIDMLAFPGHKGLYGPQGTGGLYINPKIELVPLVHGGTGSQSEAIDQPATRPDRFESGTLNTPGIAGLLAGLEFVLETGVEAIHQKEKKLADKAVERLSSITGIEIIGRNVELERLGVISFTMSGIEANELAYVLDQEYGIAVRAGFHCTPLAHETAGTMETGAVRISFGYFNEEKDVDKLGDALEEIREGYML